jgi:hypothetical protein
MKIDVSVVVVLALYAALMAGFDVARGVVRYLVIVGAFACLLYVARALRRSGDILAGGVALVGLGGLMVGVVEAEGVSRLPFVALALACFAYVVRATRVAAVR